MESQPKIPEFSHYVEVESLSHDENLNTAELLRDSLLGSNGYVCPDCHKNYKTRSTLHAHRHLKHPKNDYAFKCNSCDKEYPSIQSLRKHVQYKHLFQHRCIICYRSFENADTLQLHKETCRKVETPCPHCCKIYKSRISLRNHIKYKHPIRMDNWCHLCRRSFLSERNLGNHIATYHAPSATTCHQCDKIFASSFALQSHILYRHTENRARCSVCHKVFLSDFSMNKHFAKNHLKVE